MASGKIRTLYEGETSDTFLHVEYSGLAQEVDIEVSGGELVSSEIYGRAADLTLSEGYKRVTVKGVPLNESSSVVSINVAREGEVDVEENPLITNDETATALAEHAAKYLSMRNTYDVQYRGNPELETGDTIGMQTLYTSEMDALVLVDSISFNGALRGSAKLKGLFSKKKLQFSVALPVQINAPRYTGEELEPEWKGFYKSRMTISGTVSAAEIGTYAAIFTTKGDYVWEDTKLPGSREVTWVILKAYPNLTITPNSLSLAVGETKTLTISRLGDGNISVSTNASNSVSADLHEQSVDVTGVESGNATVTVSVGETEHYSEAFASATVTVASSSGEKDDEKDKVVAIRLPSKDKSILYNGKTQSASWKNYDANRMTMGGVTEAVNPGTYTATFTPKGDYVWEDTGKGGTREVQWTLFKGNPVLRISPSRLQIKYKGSGTFTITHLGDGKLTPICTKPEVATLTMDGLTGIVKAISEGICVVGVEIEETEYYYDSSASIIAEVESPETVSLPTQLSSISYNGKAQSPKWSGYNEDKMTIGGVTEAINAGTYTATFTPKGDYVWADTKTQDVRDAQWKINALDPNLTLKTTGDIDGRDRNRVEIENGYNAHIWCYWDGDGQLFVTNNNRAITTEVREYYGRPTIYVHTVSGYSSGTYTISIGVKESGNYRESVRAFFVSVVDYAPTPDE